MVRMSQLALAEFCSYESIFLPNFEWRGKGLNDLGFSGEEERNNGCRGRLKTSRERNLAVLLDREKKFVVEKLKKGK